MILHHLVENLIDVPIHDVQEPHPFGTKDFRDYWIQVIENVHLSHWHSVNDSRLLRLQDKVIYMINIIRDMVMQLNFTYLPKTGQHSKHMVASQTSWL